MRIGIDAHIILKEHKRYDPLIAKYTENLISHLLEADTKKEHIWVLFFDQRMKGSRKLKKFQKDNVEIKHFPFVQYRKYMPVLYSHMLISSFIAAARVDVFHSPEGLIPLGYPGRIVTSFHYVPKGETESNMFVRTFMFGARMAFSQLCKRARRIVVNSRSDKDLLTTKHGYPQERVVVMETDDLNRVDWSKRVKQLMKVYRDVVRGDGEAKAAKEQKAAEERAKKEAKTK